MFGGVLKNSFLRALELAFYAGAITGAVVGGVAGATLGFTIGCMNFGSDKQLRGAAKRVSDLGEAETEDFTPPPATEQTPHVKPPSEQGQIRPEPA